MSEETCYARMKLNEIKEKITPELQLKGGVVVELIEMLVDVTEDLIQEIEANER